PGGEFGAAADLVAQVAAGDAALVDELHAVVVGGTAQPAAGKGAAEGAHAEQSGDLDEVAGLLLHLPAHGVVGVLAVFHAAARHDPLGGPARHGRAGEQELSVAYHHGVGRHPQGLSHPGTLAPNRAERQVNIRADRAPVPCPGPAGDLPASGGIPPYAHRGFSPYIHFVFGQPSPNTRPLRQALRSSGFLFRTFATGADRPGALHDRSFTSMYTA